MGKIRESESFLFDIPKSSDILLNDILNIIVFIGEDGMDSISYDANDELIRRGILASARAKYLRSQLKNRR